MAKEYLDGRFRFTSTRRDTSEQARLYANYKAGLSTIPANPPGSSFHEYGLAVDLSRGVDPYSDPLLAQLGEWWNANGGLWSPKDPVHFQPRVFGNALSVPEEYRQTA